MCLLRVLRATPENTVHGLRVCMGLRASVSSRGLEREARMPACMDFRTQWSNVGEVNKKRACLPMLIHLHNGHSPSPPVSVVCENEKEAAAVRSQLHQILRPMYSNPPLHGSLLAQAILGDPELNALWLGEVKVGVAQDGMEWNEKRRCGTLKFLEARKPGEVRVGVAWSGCVVAVREDLRVTCDARFERLPGLHVLEAAQSVALLRLLLPPWRISVPPPNPRSHLRVRPQASLAVARP